MSWEYIVKGIPKRRMTRQEWMDWEERSKKGNKGKVIHDELKNISKNKNQIRALERKIEELKSNIKDSEALIDRVYSRNERQREAYEREQENPRKIGRLAPPEDLPPRDKEMLE
jgi:predicted RNase H-like nuclease (RuvC/YqgF family)